MKHSSSAHDSLPNFSTSFPSLPLVGVNQKKPHAMPGDVATSVQKTKIKISLSQLTTFRWTLQEEVQQLKTMGYGGIGLWRPKVSEIGEYAAADILQSSGIDVCSLSFAGGFTGRHGISFHEAQADAREAISTARLLSAENVIVVSGSQSLHTTRHSRRLVREALRELSEFAMLQGVRLSVLPMKKAFSSTWTFLNTLDETLELLDEVNHASVGMVFDTYQLSHEHRLMDRIPQLVPRIGVVQVSDLRQSRKPDSERCFPGEGRIALAEIVRCFHNCGYEGYFDVHVWPHGSCVKSRAELVSHCRDAIRMITNSVEQTEISASVDM